MAPKFFLRGFCHPVGWVALLSTSTQQYFCYRHNVPMLKAFFSSPVKPQQHAKREDVINTILYFCFKDTLKGVRRQQAHNHPQEAISKLFVSAPMATLHRVVGECWRSTGRTLGIFF